MSITASDLVLLGSANIPEDDTSTTGGAIDTAARPLDTQWTANAVAAMISDGSDTRTVTVKGRLTNGQVDTEALALNGTTEVVFTKTWERILNVVIASPDASRTVTFRQGSSGPTRHTFNPNETDAYIHFQQSASEASPTTRYEKDFWKNTHATLSLTTAEVELTADPASKIRIALASSKDDSESVANRETAPTGIGSWTDDGTGISVPTGNLGAGEGIGTWAELQLAADDAAQKTTYTTQLSGNTV